MVAVGEEQGYIRRDDIANIPRQALIDEGGRVGWPRATIKSEPSRGRVLAARVALQRVAPVWRIGDVDAGKECISNLREFPEAGLWRAVCE